MSTAVVSKKLTLTAGTFPCAVAAWLAETNKAVVSRTTLHRRLVFRAAGGDPSEAFPRAMRETRVTVSNFPALDSGANLDCRAIGQKWSAEGE
ncbi:MAG: hypothetical protein M3Z54_03160 [Gemmatimonadota bacterium]|nr:hypothetical protein [Gemmatimonadota bacterium]